MPYIDNISVAGQTYELKDTTGTFIAPQEVSPAEAAHAAGDYLVYNGTLYQASAAIAIGDALTAGTNITAVPGGIGGEVTELKSQIGNRAPIINATLSGKSTPLSDIVTADNSPFTVSVEGLGIGHLLAFNGVNLVPDMSDAVVTQQGTMEVTTSSDHITLNGTYSATIRFKNQNRKPLSQPIPAGTVFNFAALVKGASEGYNDSCRVYIYYYDADGHSDYYSPRLFNDNTYFTGNHTWQYDIHEVGLYIAGVAGWTCENLEIYPIMFAGNDYIKIDQAIAEGENYALNAETISAWDVLTTTPYAHTFSYKADTKAYIDNHVPSDYISTENIDEYIPSEYVKEQELVYISPEMYGAAGDGVADDTAAVQACVDAVVTNTSYPKIIRAYGIYKTSSPITINGRYLDVFINKIVYTGADAAVILSGSRNKFEFSRIVATTGTNAVGIRCKDNYSCCKLECNRIYSSGNTLEITFDSSLESGNSYYNTFKFQSQNSTNGHVIYVDSPYCNEIDIYGKVCYAANGYLLYFSENGKGAIRLHQYSMESGLKNGIHGNATLIDCRTSEMIDKRSPTDLNTGILFNFDGRAPSSRTKGAGSADMTCFKLDQAKTFDDLLADVKTAFENGLDSTYAWNKIPVSAQTAAVIETIHRSASASMANGSQCFLPPGTLYIYYRHMAFKPRDDWYYQVNAAELRILHTAENNYNYITPTVFDINVASAEIYLDYSYCMLAINHMQVIQHTGKTAKVYDKLGNLIFDGTNLAPGIYKFTCSFVPLDSLSVTLTNGTVKTAPDYYVRKVYTGENEKWTISKEELIES